MTTKKTQTMLAIVVAIFWFSTTHAANITVTGTGDTIAVDGFVTLREAITAANTNAASGDAGAGGVGLDTISFNIAGAPGTVHTIAPLAALPTITEPVIIDGYSQPGSTENTLATGTNAFLTIVLDGVSAGLSAGLNFTAGGSTVQGLVIHRFASQGLFLGTLDNYVIRGNFIGTDQTGTVDQGNALEGISLLTANNVIGGTSVADRNLISGNDGSGAVLSTAAAINNRIQNNLIGTTASGLAALGNTLAGIDILAGSGTTVGGLVAGTGNIIAFNGTDGIATSNVASIGHLFSNNSIHSNTDLGIDLNSDGVTVNDALDADVGPNGLQNFPVLTLAQSNQLGTRVQGTLNSTPNTTFRVEIYSNLAADASSFGEGRVVLGSVDVVTSALGVAAIEFETPTEVAENSFLTALVVAPNNSTSEFSEAIEIDITVPSVTDEDDDDDGNDVEPFPVPVPVPVPPGPPIDPIAAPVVPPVVLAATAPRVEKAPKGEFEITVDSLEEGLNADSAPKSSSSKADHEESGCSTTGGSMSFIWCVFMALYSLRQRVRARSR